MTVFYIALKFSALLAIILLPLIGPKKKRSAAKLETGSLSVNEDGYVEHLMITPAGRQTEK